MFPRRSRLRRARDISATLRRGSRVSTPALGLRYLPTKLDRPRITVVVSTAVAKRANVRNRVKRQLRHMLASELADVQRGFDLMVTVRSGYLPLDRPARLTLLHSLLERSRLISTKHDHAPRH